MVKPRWHIEGGDTYVLGLVRVGLGVVLFAHSLVGARALAKSGFFGDRFHWPMIPEAWIPPRSVWVVLVAARMLFAAMATVGQSARVGLLGAGLLGVYGMLCDRLEYSDGAYALFLFAILLSFAPSDRAFSLEHAQDESRHGPLWAQRLAQVQVSLIYVASGAAKLFDHDWRAGLALSHDVLAPRVARVALDLAIASAAAKGVIAIELFVAVGLWIGRTRTFALWLAVWFEIIAVLAGHGGLLSLVLGLGLVLFATPDAQARKLFYDPTRARGGFYAKLVGALDWLARFDIRPWAPDDIRRGHHMVIVRRDGTRATGLRAFAMVARCTPLLFLIWAPIAFVASFTKGGDASSHG